MTLDEAILHAEEVAEEKDMQAEFDTDYVCYQMSEAERDQCKKCAEEHRQLVEWLKDYKRLLEQESKTWSLDDAREEFMSDVYDTLDFLPTNNEANRIIDTFDRVTSDIRQESVLSKIRAEIEELEAGITSYFNDRPWIFQDEVLDIIDKYRESER